jgi:hypothetical protein
MPNAIELLRNDHQKVKDLFEKFENTEDKAEKKRIVQTALTELEVHAAVEEEIFYPAARRAGVESKTMNEATEEHHVAKFLISELREMRSNNPQYEAKFTVLAENVRHHIREEENEMLPDVEDTDLDLDRLGERMMSRKEALMAAGGTRAAAPSSRRTSGAGGRLRRPTAAPPRATGKVAARTRRAVSGGQRTSPRRSRS